MLTCAGSGHWPGVTCQLIRQGTERYKPELQDKARVNPRRETAS